MNRQSSRPEGFTLVETLVAVGILAIVVAMVSQGIISNLRASQETRESAAAKAYAQAMLDAYRSAWSSPDKYIAMAAPDATTLPKLPDKFKAKDPSVDFFEVGLKDSSGKDISKYKGYEQVREVRVTVFKGAASAVVMSTRISDPSKRTEKIK